MGAIVAIKRLARPLIQKKALRIIQKQVELLSGLRHPNILQFYGFSYDSINICIVSEYMPGGDLHAVLHNTSVELLWSDPLLQIATDVALGMCYLHQRNIVHRYLKSTNLLCSDTYGCKVSDFGFSKHGTADMRTVIENSYYLAPEMIRKEPYTRKVDSYAFGIILIELETRNDPYFDFHLTKMQVLNLVSRGFLPNIPKKCLPYRKALILDCLEFDPKLRPSMKDILGRLQGDVGAEINLDIQITLKRRRVRNKKFQRQKRFNSTLLQELLSSENDSGER